MASQLLRDYYTALALEADFQRLVSERVQEDIHLEFKQKRDRSHSLLEDGDARQLSRALSGFANSDGGILIWGIATDREERASDLKPITNVSDFHSRLKKSLLHAVQPVIEAISLETVELATGQDHGFVKCLVPASDRAPHRAMLAQREYFKRSTEGFYRLEHFDLEDMFGRRPKSRIVLRTLLAPRGGVSGHGFTTRHLHAIFTIENEGRGSAGAPYLALTVHAPYRLDRFGLDGNGQEGLPRHVSGEEKRTVFGGNAGISVHAGVAHDVAAVKVEVVEVEGRVGTTPQPLVVDYVLAAEGAPAQEGQVVIPAQDLTRAVGL